MDDNKSPLKSARKRDRANRGASPEPPSDDLAVAVNEGDQSVTSRPPDAPASRVTMLVFVVLAVLLVGQTVWLGSKTATRPVPQATVAKGSPSGAATTNAGGRPQATTQMGPVIVHGTITGNKGKLALKHGEIAELRMAAGTTSFKADSTILNAFNPGNEVDVFIDVSSGEPVILKIFLMPNPDEKASASTKNPSAGSSAQPTSPKAQASGRPAATQQQID